MDQVYQWLRSVGGGRLARSDESVLVINYMHLRKTVGWVGTLLPVILLVATPMALAIENSPCAVLPGSVSGYYYSPGRNIFVGVQCAIGLFLIAYVGYDLGDRLVTDAAGVFAVGWRGRPRGSGGCTGAAGARGHSYPRPAAADNAPGVGVLRRGRAAGRRVVAAPVHVERPGAGGASAGHGRG